MPQQGQVSTLESIFSDSFPANHLLQISMVKQSVEESYKKQYFCFITLAPGEQSQGGGRTFNFNNRINLKVEYHKIRALGHALTAYAKGQESLIGPFSIYVDSSKSQYGQGGGGGKSIGLQRTTNPKQNNTPLIVLYFKAGTGSALAFSMNPADALALADTCFFIANKCQELEFLRTQASTHTGTYMNPNIGTPPAMSTLKTPQFSGAASERRKVINTPGRVVDNFADGFENFQNSLPLDDFDDPPF